MKDELGGKTMKNFDGLRAKTCSYLIDDGTWAANIGSQDVSRTSPKDPI